MVSSRNISGRQKTLPRVYPEKKAVQLSTNQGEPNMYPAQTKDKSRGEQNNDLMEEVLSRQNMLKALKRVEKNKCKYQMKSTPYFTRKVHHFF